MPLLRQCAEGWMLHLRHSENYRCNGETLRKAWVTEAKGIVGELSSEAAKRSVLDKGKFRRCRFCTRRFLTSAGGDARTSASRGHLCRKYRRETRNVRFCVLGPVFPDQVVWAQDAQNS